jgi:hypothetical protein
MNVGWASPIRARFNGWDATYARLGERDARSACRWLLARLKAEWLLSDGDPTHQTWHDEADRIEALAGA